MKTVLNTCLFWVKSETDLKPCNKCEEIIYGDMWKPTIELSAGMIEDISFNELDLRLCHSCAEILHIMQNNT